MTAPKPDDRAFVDPHVAAAWRDASNDEPPASVDAAILAAARREVTAGPEPVDTREARTDRRRWWPLAAAATVAAVVVGVVQLTPIEKLGAPATDTGVVSDVPAPGAPPPAASMPVQPPVALPRPDAGAAAPAPTPAPMPAPFPAAKPAPEGVRPAPPAALSAAPAAPAEPAPPPAAVPAPTPDPFPVAKQAAADKAAGRQLAASPPPAPPRSEAAENAARERDSGARGDSGARERDSMAAREAPAPPPVAQSATRVAAERPPAPPSATLGKMSAGRAADSGVDDVRAKERTPLPVPEWIALIRRLRAEGKPAEAAKELAAFRAAHADHEKLLPPDLRDWQAPEK